MVKPYYAEYVNHMLRCYARESGLSVWDNTDEVGEQNNSVVDRVLDDLPGWDRTVLINLFNRGDTLADNIYEVSQELKINQDVLWIILSKVTKKIAKERGLI